MIRRLSPLLVFLLTAGLYLSGGLEFIERRITDTGFRAIERPASGQVVLVEIDERSLRELDVWPWPRRHHARLIERLLAAGARTIALDLDLSSRSNPEDDRALARAAAAAGDRLVLPVFKQAQRGPAGELVTYRTRPLPAFRETARLAVVNVRPEDDGLVRRLTVSEPWGSAELPTLPAVLAAPMVVPRGAFHVDFGIRPRTMPRISYANVLAGRFEPSAVAGKIVIVGASAVSLGDMVATPVYAAVPGMLLQALALESIFQGRALQRLGAGPILIIALLLAGLLGWPLNRVSWRRGLALAAAAGGGVTALSFAAQAWLPLLPDVAPWLVTVALSYAVSLIARVDEQSLKLLLQGLAMRRTDAFMRNIVGNTFDGIITVEDDGTIRSFNASAEKIFGYGAEEVVGKSCGLVLDIVSGAMIWEGRFDPASLATGTHEARGLHKSGARPDLELAVSAMDLDDGRVLVVVARDVTARKAAEAAARKAEERLDDAVDSVDQGFVLFDEEDRFVLANARFRSLHAEFGELLVPGWRFEDFVQASATLGLYRDAEDDVEGWIAGRMERHRNPSGPFEQATVDGRWYLVSEQRTSDGGTVILQTDITDIKRAQQDMAVAKEEAERANRMKSEFLATMSHELRTPLNAILGFSEMIKSELFGPLGSPQYKEYAEDIHSSGSHLLDIIMDILDMAKIESGKFELIEEEVLAEAAISACLRMVDERAREAGLKIDVDLPADLPILRADDRVFKQIVLNLLSNAVKFTPERGRVTVSASAPADGSFRVVVADTGIGMTAEDIATALEPFAQVDSELHRKYEGTGLGLPLVKSLTELHGGSLAIESRPGRGTVVTVVFPRDRVLTEAAAAEKEAGEPAQ